MPPERDGVERRDTQPSYVRGGSAPRPNPLTFYVPLLTGKVPLSCYTATLSIVNAPSFHINKTPNQEVFLSFSQPKMRLLAGF